MGDVITGITALLTRQRGLVARHQLTAAGVTRSRLRWHLHTGRWTVVLPGVFAMFSGELHRDHQLIAALLHGGPQARLTGATALAVHGFHNVPKDHGVRIAVPGNRRVPSTGFVQVHRTIRPDPYARTVGGLRVASPERSVVEAARTCTDPRRVRAVVAEAVQSGHCTPGDLVREYDAAPRAGTALLRHALTELLSGVRSVAEGDARKLLAASTVLPPLLWNPQLVSPGGAALPTPDGWLAEVDLAVEVDSRAYHLGPDDWEQTMRRHTRLTEAGAVVLHFSPTQFHESPATVVRSVERAYLARLTAGHRTQIRAIPH